MEDSKYVLFGAGQVGRTFVDVIGRENVICFLDNDLQKIGKKKYGIPVLSMDNAKEIINNHCIVVTVGKEKKNEIISQLNSSNVKSIYFEELQRQLLKKKIESRTDYIDIYYKAVGWIKDKIVDNKGIINRTGLDKPYPEVTGYFIPSLIRWGYRDIAISFAKWLCEIQKPDGSWYDTEDKQPYIFDSAQILKGLLSARHLYPEVDMNIRKGCDWILSNMEENGRLPSPRENDFGDEKTFAEFIHIYCLSPLVEAGEILNIPEYREKAYRILYYYKEHVYDKIMNFSLLSHFYAYIMEGLLDMGEEKMVRQAMENISCLQKENGSIPGYSNVGWICSTGLFQMALVWFRIGEMEKGNKAFQYACKNASGGWFGSYLSEENPEECNTYFPNSEISWAVKYFLDALYWKNKMDFERQAHRFKSTINFSDGRYQVIENIVKCLLDKRSEMVKVADLGCGKGAYLKNLYKVFPEVKYVAVDLSETVMGYMGSLDVDKRQGSLTNIPYEDNAFDCVYTCEALEHAIDIESAVREMSRVTKPGGVIAIIDKNKDMLGYYDIGEWEQWFDEEELSEVMSKYCRNISVIKEVGFEKSANGLFYAWIGVAK